MDELGVCVMVFVVKDHDARLTHSIHNFLTYLHGSTVDGQGVSAQFQAPRDIVVDSSGNFYVSEVGGKVIRKITPSGGVTTIAGSGAEGFADSSAAQSTFVYAEGLALDEARQFLYVADAGNHAIRKINLGLAPSDSTFVTTLAGGSFGFEDGSGSNAKFYHPNSLDLDSSGNIYVADTSNRRIRKITPTGDVSTIAGSGVSGSLDGVGQSAQFQSPQGVVVVGDNTLFVTDSRSLRLVDLTTMEVSTILDDTGTGSYSRMALAPNGDLILGDQHSLQGVNISGGMSFGDMDGDTLSASLSVDHGALFVTLSGSAQFSSGANGEASIVLGGSALDLTETLNSLQYQGDADYWGEDALVYSVSDGELSSPKNTVFIVVNPVDDGPPELGEIQNLAFYEDTEHTVTLSATDIDGDPLTFSAVNSTHISASVDGSSLTLSPARDWSGTETIAISVEDGNGGSDSGTFSITVNPVDDPPQIVPTMEISGNEDSLIPIVDQGFVSTFSGGESGYQDGDVSEARYSRLSGIVADSVGNLFVLEYGNSYIRKITPEGVVSTFAGSGNYGFKDGIGADAEFQDLENITIDAFDNLYVSHPTNNQHVIRKVTPHAKVSTLIVSNGNDTVDGAAGVASFNIQGLAFDPTRNYLYFTDGIALSVRKIDLGEDPSSAGYLTTLAGQGSTQNVSGDGTGSEARFAQPLGLTLDNLGNIYVADGSFDRIRKVTPEGIVTSIAGRVDPGNEDGPGLEAGFNYPHLITIDDFGENLYVVSSGYMRKIKLGGDYEVTTLFGDGQESIEEEQLDGDFSVATFPFYDSQNTGLVFSEGCLFFTEDGQLQGIRKADLPGSIVVKDLDSDSLTIELSVTHGHLSVTLVGGVSISSGAIDSPTIVIEGSADELNETLANLNFHPDPDFWGTATLTSSLSDGNTTIPEEISGIYVAPVNDGAPVLTVIGDQTLDEDSTLEIQLSATDIDGDPLVYSASTTPRIQATVEGNVLTLIPAVNWYGSESITVTVDDQNGGTDSEVILVTVTPQNDAPQLRKLAEIRTAEDTAILVHGNPSWRGVANGHTSGPKSIVSDTNGNVFYPDSENHKVWKVTFDGNVGVFAGSGVAKNEDGIGAEASFSHPYQIEIDAWDNLYISTRGENYGDVIRRVTPDGMVTTIAGNGVDDAINGPGLEASFGFIEAMAFDRKNNYLYTVGMPDHNIRKINLNLPGTHPNFVTTFVGGGVSGHQDGVGANVGFSHPWDMDADSEGNLYVADSYRIRKVTPEGVVSTIAGSGADEVVDGVGTNASFTWLDDIIVFDDHTLYVENGDLRRIKLGSEVVVEALKFFEGTISEITYGVGTMGSGGYSRIGWELVSFARNADRLGYDDFGGAVQVADLDGDTLTVVLEVGNGSLSVGLVGNTTISGGSNQSASITLEGLVEDLNATLETLTYIGNQDFSGTDTLTYSVSDGEGTSGELTTRIVVEEIQDGAPTFEPITPVTLDEDSSTELTISATDPDGDPISYSATGSQHLQVSLDGTDLTITPAANWYGTETITVTAEDGVGGTGLATVSVTVAPVDDPVTISGAGTVTGNEDKEIPFAFSVNDVDGDILTVTLSTNHGTLTATLSGGATVTSGENGSKTLGLQGTMGDVNATLASLQYLGDNDFYGEDSYTYSVTDGTTTTDPASGVIHVQPVNDGAPELGNIGSLATYQDTALSITLVATDVDGDELTFSVSSSPHISASLAGTTLQLVPANGWSGEESLTVTVEDGQGGADSETFSVTVLAVQAPEVENPYTIFGREGEQFPVQFGGVVSELAGRGYPGFSNGAGTDAMFWAPSGIVADDEGNLYVADTRNHCIRKITLEGEVTTITGYASQATQGLGGIATRLVEPRGIEVDANGNLYVSQHGRHNIVKIATDGSGEVIAGTGKPGNLDGDSGDAEFNSPWGLALDRENQLLYVADRGNHSIRRIDLLEHPAKSSKIVTLAGSGTPGFADGDGDGAAFQSPTGLDIDDAGNLYVADTLNHQIRKVTPEGIVSTLAGDGLPGHIDGEGPQSRFYSPMDVSVYNGETLFVVGESNFFREIKLGGGVSVSSLFGDGNPGTTSGDIRTATLDMPSGVTNHGGKLFFTQTGADYVRQVLLERPVSIRYPDEGNLQVLLSVGSGILEVDLAGSTTITTGANGTHIMLLEGIGSDVNATLETLHYQGGEGFWGMDFLWMTVSNGISEPIGKLVSIVVEPASPDADGDGVKDQEEPNQNPEPGNSHGETPRDNLTPIVKTFDVELGYRLMGQVESDGGSDILEVGFRLSSTSTFLSGLTTTYLANLDASGEFQFELFDYSEQGTFYVQSFATNDSGTSYGLPREFLYRKPEFNIWENAQSLGDSGWLNSAIGVVFVEPGSKWVYHSDWGWLYVEGKSLADFWIWIPSNGWHWSSLENYPYLFRESQGGWVYWMKDESFQPMVFNALSGLFEDDL